MISIDQGVASLNVDSSSKPTREVKRSLRELQDFFARDQARQGRLWNYGGAAFIALITVGLVLFRRDEVAIVVWPSLLGLVGATLFVVWRYHPDASRLVSRLDLPDRLLLAHVVDAPRREVSSVVRALGTYVHPVLIATDRRLILVRAKWNRLGRSSRRGLRIVWELPYTDVRSFSSRSTGDKLTRETVVNVKAADREISHKLSPAGATALVAILKRRAPAALAEPVPPPRLTGARR
jgi:hypothetical protein